MRLQLMLQSAVRQTESGVPYQPVYVSNSYNLLHPMCMYSQGTMLLYDQIPSSSLYSILPGCVVFTWMRCNELSVFEMFTLLACLSLSLSIAAKDCHHPPNVENGLVTHYVYSTTVNSSVTYACRHGYMIHGNPTIRCHENGTWTPTPICHSKTKAMGNA